MNTTSGFVSHIGVVRTEDARPSNVSGMTVDFYEWVSAMTPPPTIPSGMQNSGNESSIMDFECAEYLRPIVDHYMMQPVGKHPYNHNIYEAKSFYTKDLVEFREKFLSQGKKIVLYMCCWERAYPSYSSVDTKTWEVRRSQPTIIGGHWRIRFSEL